jgi:hypothetical protein
MSFGAMLEFSLDARAFLLIEAYDGLVALDLEFEALFLLDFLF